MKPRKLLISATLILSGGSVSASTYQEDLALLKRHTQIIELVSGDARVAIAPAWQGRVMTSTATGPAGAGFGWINPEVIAQGIKPESERTGLAKHIHVFGGEERLWFGPEGGPFALFFPPKVEQTFENWKTPAVIDTEPFEVSGTPTGTSAAFSRSFPTAKPSGHHLRHEGHTQRLDHSAGATRENPRRRDSGIRPRCCLHHGKHREKRR